MSEQELVTILHVDDNEVNRYIVARMLQDAGFEVKEAATGEAGLQLAAQQQPDLIILDVQLPDINGFEVCRRIKANSATSSIPVLHLSASFVKSEDKVQGLEGGADGYLAQPVEPIELLATVNALLRIRQAEESALALAREWQTTFDAISDGVCLLDLEGRVLRCNIAMTKLLRKPFSEINGQFHQELMQTMLGFIEVTPFTRVKEVHRRESMELQFGVRWFSVTIDPVFGREGVFTGAVYIVADITGRKWAESALQKANDELEIRVENRTTELRNANERLQSEIIERQRAEEAIQESQTRLKLTNSISTAMMLGMSVEQIIERTVKQISEYFTTLRVAYSTIDNMGNLTVIYSIEPQGMPQIKGLVVNLSAAQEYLSALSMNEPVIVEDVAHDVRLASLSGAILIGGTQALLDVPLLHPDKLVGLLCFDSPQPRNWSEHEIATLIGIAQHLTIIIKNAYAQQERKRAEDALQAANDELEVRVRKRTAELALANEELRSEITDRKQAEERLRLALEAAHMSTWDWDILTNQVTWFDNHEPHFGLTTATFGGTYEAFLSCVYHKDREFLTQAMLRAVEEKMGYDNEFRIVWPDGSIRWLAWKGQAFYDETGTTAVRMIGTTMDITYAKQTAEQIKASLREKEVLLKEIHHRVKNNMQVICSVLNLQSASIEDPQTLELLQEAQNRVSSMALVHEQLYQSEDLASIDFAEYIQNLVANLFSSYDVSSEAIALKININNLYLSVDTAIPCGLIINELISNSLKYAFLPGKKGEICIHFYSDTNNQFNLIVSDNGIGFPQDLDFRKTESLGLQLVTALTAQLSGTIELKRNIGTEFKITFQEQNL